MTISFIVPAVWLPAVPRRPSESPGEQRCCKTPLQTGRERETAPGLLAPIPVTPSRTRDVSPSCSRAGAVTAAVTPSLLGTRASFGVPGGHDAVTACFHPKRTFLLLERALSSREDYFVVVFLESFLRGKV